MSSIISNHFKCHGVRKFKDLRLLGYCKLIKVYVNIQSITNINISNCILCLNVFKAERLARDSTKINSQNELALSVRHHQLND